MNICYVNKTTATIYETTGKTKQQASKESVPETVLTVSAIADEGLYGMPLLILEECGAYYKIRTHYSYEGYIQKEDVLFKETLLKQKVVDAVYTDILSLPKVQGVPLLGLTRGCLVEVTGETVNGWQEVLLLDGTKGYMPEKYLIEKRFPTDCFDAAGTASDEQKWKTYLQELLKTYFHGSEDAFRDAVVDTALTYAGTQYRWGGKTPIGTDCSGFTSMSYMLNGVLTYRDASIVNGFPVKEIPRESMKKGDLLYFAGHIAMYIGEGAYIHSTAKAGSNGVDINSFDTQDKRYRKDLDEGLLKTGTIFW